ncbi:MAG: hypothetical protein MR966_02675 [Lachnospiraceae bacterium]|nr:hypothetical protein [Lachnospiraceae bacterium]
MNELMKKILRQQAILNAARQANRDLTDEERNELDTLQNEINQITRDMNGQGNSGRQSVSAAVPAAGTEPTSTGSGDPESAQRAVETERQRINDIVSICRQAGMEIGTYIQDGTTADAVRQAALDHLIRGGAPVSTGVRVTENAEDKTRAAMADALVVRGGISLRTPAEGYRDFMGMSLRDLAIECIQKETGETGLNRRSNDDLFGMLQRQFYNPTSAFPSIMDQAIQKSYKEGHETVPVTFDKWVKKGTLNDFKIHDNYWLSGPAGEFLEVPESGELKHDVYSDEKLPTRKLKTYGRQFTMTRQAFINDDIGFLSKVPAKYAASARRTQNKQAYQILMKNPAIYDGANLFCAAHKNVLASGTGITREGTQSMLIALQTQKNQFNEDIIIRPATIVCGVGMEFDMYTLFYSPTINTSDNTQAVNPLYKYKDQIQVVSDPLINSMAGSGNVPWFLLGDKADTDFVEIDYLNGQEVPTIRRSEQAGTLGFVWDIYLDWGYSCMDYRGAVKNPGTVISAPIGVATE